MLAHDVEGDGPAILFVHEGIADRRMWDPQVGPFADAGFRVVRCDLRGYGESAVPSGEISNTGDLRELLEHLGIERATVVGGSYGGRVALEYALTYPESVEALVLIAPGLRDADWSEEIRRFGAEEEALLEAGDVDGAVELNLRTWVDGPSRTPDQVDSGVRERVRDMQRRAFDLQLGVPYPGEEPFEPPVSARLDEIGFPVLLLVGDLDQPDMLRIAERLAAGIPGARKEVIRGTAHMPSMERPEEFDRLVLGFLHAAGLGRQRP